MATACNKELRNCGKRIIEESERSELQLTRIAPDEIEAVPVSFTSTSVPDTTTSISSTTLQDLPNEILDYILMKAVVKKVLVRKLAKSAWIDYAWRVIQPMRTVWSRWNYNLTTNWFRIVLSRNLNKKNAARISVAEIDVIPYDEEDLQGFRAFAKQGNQMYLFCGYNEDCPGYEFDRCCLLVFEDKDMSCFTKSIPLPLTEVPSGAATCYRSKSIYLWGRGPDVFHLIPDRNGSFDLQRWPDYSPPSDFLDHPDAIGNYYHIDSFSVLDDWNLLVKRCIVAEENIDPPYDWDWEEEIILSVQKPDGLVIRNTKLPRCCQSSNAVMKSNGNFVYALQRDDIVVEVDQDGNEIRRFHWIRKNGPLFKLFLDSHDRVILQYFVHDLIILDDELNFVEEVHVEVPEFCLNCCYFLVSVDFYRETNEMVFVFRDDYILLVKLTLQRTCLSR